MWDYSIQIGLNGKDVSVYVEVTGIEMGIGG
jgi:hypothetical protein